VATALDLSPFGSALVQAVLPLTAPQAAQAFDALSGEIHASVETVLFDDSRYMRQAVLGRLRQASFGDEIGLRWLRCPRAAPRWPMLNRSPRQAAVPSLRCSRRLHARPIPSGGGRASAHGAG